jgi:beta-xylosidase
VQGMSPRFFAATLITLPLSLPANPVMEGADPHVQVVGTDFWLYPTEAHSRKPIFAAYRSTDLRTWKRTGIVLDLDQVPWVKADGAPWHGAWAPAIAQRKGKFYFYYSVGPQNPTPSRIGVAVGTSPAGPFTDSGKPLLTGGDGFEAIDPMVFVEGDKAWFYAGGSAGSKLRVFEMADDMVSFKREVKIEQPPHFTEAPFVHRRGDIYYLSYSHGRWNDSSYCVHYATAASPSGPWEYRGKILESDATRQGPGHHAFFEDPKIAGVWSIAYHRWESEKKEGPFRGGRKIAVEIIDYDAKGLIRPVKMTDRR